MSFDEEPHEDSVRPFSIGDKIAVFEKVGEPGYPAEVILEGHESDSRVVYAHHPDDVEHPMIGITDIDNVVLLPDQAAPELIDPSS